MGKKKSGNGGGCWEEEAAVPAREFVLKVDMHCGCHGCAVKVRAAVRKLTQAPGVKAADTSAAESRGEVRLLATADPEKLRLQLHDATRKKVDLLLPPSSKERAARKAAADRLADAAALDALLADLQLQQQAPAGRQHQYGGGQAAWAANQQMVMGLGLGGGAGGYGTAAPYPWSSSSAPSYYQAAPGAGWGAYTATSGTTAAAHRRGSARVTDRSPVLPARAAFRTASTTMAWPAGFCITTTSLLAAVD